MQNKNKNYGDDSYFFKYKQSQTKTTPQLYAITKTFLKPVADPFFKSTVDSCSSRCSLEKQTQPKHN